MADSITSLSVQQPVVSGTITDSSIDPEAIWRALDNWDGRLNPFQSTGVVGVPAAPGSPAALVQATAVLAAPVGTQSQATLLAKAQALQTARLAALAPTPVAPPPAPAPAPAPFVAAAPAPAAVTVRRTTVTTIPSAPPPTVKVPVSAPIAAPIAAVVVPTSVAELPAPAISLAPVPDPGPQMTVIRDGLTTLIPAGQATAQDLANRAAAIAFLDAQSARGAAVVVAPNITATQDDPPISVAPFVPPSVQAPAAITTVTTDAPTAPGELPAVSPIDRVAALDPAPWMAPAPVDPAPVPLAPPPETASPAQGDVPLFENDVSGVNYDTGIGDVSNANVDGGLSLSDIQAGVGALTGLANAATGVINAKSAATTDNTMLFVIGAVVILMFARS